MSIAAYQGVCPTCRHDHSADVLARTTRETADHAELAACPFCGGAAEIVHIEEGENQGGSCVCCTACQASGNLEFGRKENFTSNWNRRRREDALLSEIAALRDYGRDAAKEALEYRRQSDSLRRLRDDLRDTTNAYQARYRQAEAERDEWTANYDRATRLHASTCRDLAQAERQRDELRKALESHDQTAAECRIDGARPQRDTTAPCELCGATRRESCGRKGSAAYAFISTARTLLANQGADHD